MNTETKNYELPIRIFCDNIIPCNNILNCLCSLIPHIYGTFDDIRNNTFDTDIYAEHIKDESKLKIMSRIYTFLNNHPEFIDLIPIPASLTRILDEMKIPVESITVDCKHIIVNVNLMNNTIIEVKFDHTGIGIIRGSIVYFISVNNIELPQCYSTHPIVKKHEPLLYNKYCDNKSCSTYVCKDETYCEEEYCARCNLVFCNDGHSKCSNCSKNADCNSCNQLLAKNMIECQICSHKVFEDNKYSRRYIAAKCSSNEKCVQHICNDCAERLHKITHNNTCPECDSYTNISGIPACPFCRGELVTINGYNFVKPIIIPDYPEILPQSLRQVWNQVHIEKNVKDTLTLYHLLLIIEQFKNN